MKSPENSALPGVKISTVKGVILASGLARRMGGIPKGLIRVGGREILYRNVHLLRNRGIGDFIIVANRWNEKAYREFMEKHFSGSIRWEIVLNDAPHRENGYSLHLVQPYVDGPFALTMADHVYSAGFISRAFELYRGTPAAVVDRNPLYIDIQEATKVKCRGNRVAAVGKGLEEYDGADTGLFFLNTDVFRITESLLMQEVIPLAKVMEEYHPECLEVSAEVWMDVDTPQEIRKATWLLIRDATKGKGDGWISRHINRPISHLITYATVEHLTPNAASLISFIGGIIAAATAVFHPPAGAVLYQIHSILDGVDGEIARVRLMESRAGGWMDSILDRVVDFLFLLALSLHLKPSAHTMLWVMAAVFGTLMVSYVSERFRGAYCRDPYGIIPPLSWIPGKRDERIFLIMILVLAGRVAEAFIAVALLGILKTLWNFLHMFRWSLSQDSVRRKP